MWFPRSSSFVWMLLNHASCTCFTQSFHFHLRFKGFVNKISHSLYTNNSNIRECTYSTFNILTLKEKRNRNSRRYITILGFWPTSRLKQHRDVSWHSTSGVQTGKRSQAAHPLHGWDSKNCSSWFPRIIPQTDIITTLWANCTSGFLFMLFVLSWKLGMLLNLGLGWPDPLQGLNRFRVYLLSYLWCWSLELTAGSQGTHSEGSVQAG